MWVNKQAAFIPAFNVPLALAVKDCVFQDSCAQLATTCHTYVTIQLNFDLVNHRSHLLRPNEHTISRPATISNPIEYYRSKSVSVPFPNTLDALVSTPRFTAHVFGFGNAGIINRGVRASVVGDPVPAVA